MAPISQVGDPRVAQTHRTFYPGLTHGFPALGLELLTE